MEEDVLTMGLFCGILKENQMMRNTREGEDMDYLVHNIASNLNHIRKAKGMSLDVVAEQTGVSKSMLAAIEKEAANPSIGVLGKIMSYMHYGIKPDIVSMAKAFGGGMPIGAICAREEVAKAFTMGSHGTTFGGHPVCCAVLFYALVIVAVGLVLTGPEILASENGTGLVTAFSVITDHARNYKLTVFSYKLIPKYAILDADFLTTAPARVAAACGIDAMVHAIEAYISRAASPFSDAMAEKALELIGGNIAVNPRATTKADVLALYRKAL